MRPFGSNHDLISRQRRGEARAEERRDPLRAHQPVAVLAGVGALVAAHQLGRLLGDRAHAHRAVALHVEHRAHVQAAHRGVRVPGALGAVLAEDLGQLRGVLGQVLERHRAVLDEGHRLPVALHRHHDVEPRLAHVPERLLPRRRRGPRPRRRGSRGRPCSSARRFTPSACGCHRRRRRTPPAGSRRARPSGTRSRSARTPGCARARSSIVRSTSSTAQGPSFTMCCAASIAS